MSLVIGEESSIGLLLTAYFAQPCLWSFELGKPAGKCVWAGGRPASNEVASQVAIAVENALNFEQAQAVQQQLKEEHDRLRLLLDVNNTIVSALDLHELLNAVSASLRRLVPHEYASLSLYDAETQRLQIHALDFPASKGLIQEGLWIPVEGTPHGRA